ncbi:extracellular solute-binding protein [Paenibacillus psychroresistens]|uniref:Extracellular solute-binding protein n=1 Tax=Paenibacillus psychroresistens TaxID=1778678 RepID=A0A6B8RVS2_9BACL|nr:extracellular solute-binding protein [Paenibacillus psychroresistens]QGQ99859.1 extracellular solute-binding protein [Paenibacillus psychroresistens]
MKASKRLWGSVATILLISTALMGCTSNKEDTKEATSAPTTAATAAASTEKGGLDITKHVELQVYMLGDAPKGLADVQAEVNKLSEKDLNATVKFNYIPWTDWETKYKLLLTSGQTIDLIYVAPWTKFVQYAKDGAFLPLDELAPKVAPELYKLIPQDLWNAVKVNGKIYDAPNTWKQYQNVGVLWRDDLREKYNLPKPTTIEDYEVYMEGIKKNEPDMLPTAIEATASLPGTWRLLNLKHKFYNQDFPNEFGMAIMNDKPAEVVNFFQSPMFAEDAKQWKSWADKGYWSKSALSDKTTASDTFTSGKAAVITGVNAPNYGGIITSLATQHPDWKLAFSTFPETTGVVHTASNNGNDGYAIPTTSKNPERALAFFEKLVTDKRYNYLTEYGIEGKHYTITSDGFYQGVGDAKTTEFPREAMNGWAWRNPAIQLFDKSFTPVLDIFKKLDAIATPDVTSNFQFDDASVKAEIAAYQTVKVQYLAPIEAGLVPDVDSAIATFLAKAKAAGLEKIQQTYTEQYNKYAADNGIK